MFCKNCGVELKDGLQFCTKCGASQNGQVANGSHKNINPQDAPSFGFAVLGFFIPIVGLILYLVWKDETPLKAKSAGKGALISVVLSVILYIIYFIVLGSMIGFLN